MRCVILNPLDEILLYSKFSVECEADDQCSGRADMKLKCATTGNNKNACGKLDLIDDQGYLLSGAN